MREGSSPDTNAHRSHPCKNEVMNSGVCTKGTVGTPHNILTHICARIIRWKIMKRWEKKGMAVKNECYRVVNRNTSLFIFSEVDWLTDERHMNHGSPVNVRKQSDLHFEE